MSLSGSVSAAAERIIKLRGNDVLGHNYPHTCLRDKCQPWCETDLVNFKLMSPMERSINSSVYVCRLRNIHVCTRDECLEYIDTHDGTCPISALHHGHTRDDRGYVAPEDRTARYKRGTSVPGKRNRDAIEDAGGEAALSPDEEKRQRLEYLQSFSKTSALGALFQTTQSAAELEAIHAAPAPVKQEGPPKHVVVPRVRKNQSTQKKLQENHHAAEAIIVQMLYSDDRKAINQQKREQLNAQRDQAIKNYYAECDATKSFPIVVDVLTIAAGYDTKPNHMRILNVEPERIKRYIDICLQTWNIVLQTPWSVQNTGYRFDAHVLSVLYCMRNGLKLNKFSLLPADKYLLKFLPSRIDLPLFGKGYESRVVTNGIKHLTSAYKSAINHKDWTPQRLMLQ